MTEVDVFKLLKQQEEDLRKKPIFYVYYDFASRKVLSIRNYIESLDSMPYVEMTTDEFDFTVSDFNITEYVIIPSEKKLKKITDELNVLSIITNRVYEIPKVLIYNNELFDLLIEQNNSTKEFRIKLSDTLRDKFIFQSMSSQKMEIYVTAENDPNILYKTLKFTFGNLVANEYHSIPFEDFKGDKVNIYALKYFENYLHVDLR